jgi:hypothetical protein
MTFLLVLSAVLSSQASPSTTADADLWTAAVEQLRRGLFGSDRGELVIVNYTIPTAELHSLSDSPRETHLLDLLRQRNDATRKPISGVGCRRGHASSPQPRFPTRRTFQRPFLPAKSW